MKARWGTQAVLAVFGALAAFVLMQSLARDATPPDLYAPSTTIGDTGAEQILVFLGSNACAACRSEEFQNDVRKLKRFLATEAREKNLRFAAIGVATDWDIQEGLSLLNRMGAWDQVVLGRSWLNEMVIRFVWRDFVALPEVPQVLLLHRHVLIDESGITVGADSVISRNLGPRDVRAWLATELGQ